MKIALAAVILLLIVAVPLLFIYRRAKGGKKGKAPFIANLCCFFGLVVFASVFLFSQGAAAAEAATAAAAAPAGDSLTLGLRYIAAALAVGLSGIGGGIAVASSASAALGALSESDAIFGKSLIYVGLAEGVALYGLLIAFMIIPT